MSTLPAPHISDPTDMIDNAKRMRDRIQAAAAAKKTAETDALAAKQAASVDSNSATHNGGDATTLRNLMQTNAGDALKPVSSQDRTKPNHWSRWKKPKGIFKVNVTDPSGPSNYCRFHSLELIHPDTPGLRRDYTGFSMVTPVMYVAVSTVGAMGNIPKPNASDPILKPLDSSYFLKIDLDWTINDIPEEHRESGWAKKALEDRADFKQMLFDVEDILHESIMYDAKTMVKDKDLMGWTYTSRPSPEEMETPECVRKHAKMLEALRKSSAVQFDKDTGHWMWSLNKKVYREIKNPMSSPHLEACLTQDQHDTLRGIKNPVDSAMFIRTALNSFIPTKVTELDKLITDPVARNNYALAMSHEPTNVIYKGWDPAQNRWVPIRDYMEEHTNSRIIKSGFFISLDKVFPRGKTPNMAGCTGTKAEFGDDIFVVAEATKHDAQIEEQGGSHVFRKTEQPKTEPDVKPPIPVGPPSYESDPRYIELKARSLGQGAPLSLDESKEFIDFMIRPRKRTMAELTALIASGNHKEEDLVELQDVLSGRKRPASEACVDKSPPKEQKMEIKLIDNEPNESRGEDPDQDDQSGPTMTG